MKILLILLALNLCSPLDYIREPSRFVEDTSDDTETYMLIYASTVSFRGIPVFELEDGSTKVEEGNDILSL